MPIFAGFESPLFDELGGSLVLVLDWFWGSLLGRLVGVGVVGRFVVRVRVTGGGFGVVLVVVVVEGVVVLTKRGRRAGRVGSGGDVVSAAAASWGRAAAGAR